jgi:acyl-coenzyme A thioesterase PaaI-like protein
MWTRMWFVGSIFSNTMTYTTPEDELIVVKEREGGDSTSNVSVNPSKDVPGLAISTEESNASSGASSSSGRGHPLHCKSSTTVSSLTSASDEAESPDRNVAAASDPFASFANGERLVLPEWENADDFRSQSGWHGHDLVHSVHSAVRVLEYYCQYGAGTDILCTVPSEPNADASSTSHAPPPRGGSGTVLTGFVHFTKQAESHQGYCHGGAACSIMDDVLGWTAFCVTGQVRPWSGYTVQINTQLLRPIPVNSCVYVAGTITKVVRRKVYVSAELYDVPTTASDTGDRVVYATCEGIVVLNKGILHVPE